MRHWVELCNSVFAFERYSFHSVKKRAVSFTARFSTPPE
jgi:hypothetical protein